MGLPGHRRTSSHKRRRASHFALSAANLTVCSHCKQPARPHHACVNCGYYKGKQVTKVKSKILTRATKAKKNHEKDKLAKEE